MNNGNLCHESVWSGPAGGEDRNPQWRKQVISWRGSSAHRAGTRRNLYNFAVKEDSVVEYLTALMYVVVVGLAVTIALHLGRTNRLAATAYILLAAAGVFIAGEEISWGQRIFGFAGPPELVEANYQGEANLHNLLGRHLLHGSYILVGLYGAFGRLLVPKIGWLRPAFLYAPSRWLATWFGTAAALYIYFDYIETPMASLFESYPVASQIGYDRLQEVVEFNLSVGFVLFVAYVLHRVRTAAPVQLSS